MARNIEIKAQMARLDAVVEALGLLGAEGPTEILQDDTFFRCETGRLKLRAFSASQGELIFYRRDNQHGPKESFYVRAPTSDPDALRQALTLAHGECGRVIKQRTLYLVGRTRVHLDRVEGLGNFLELEVVMDEDEPVSAGVDEAHRLMTALGVQPHQLVADAYVDLLTRGRTQAHDA
ncbi:class IV adenylate cyclase [Piscinibacter gummiphilus]|uniref:Class IV adenylate cyclase n=1 Tax=Piscinibacter gummiphilus TaxID=946333 RepID=A0ABZ0CSA8_9BURK|nr:class IV adenylate cyclase [Piscinibacter gummiphilus]WOB07876.1 class IV adenylate cyclase [Piscinibacter gummiphilus]